MRSLKRAASPPAKSRRDDIARKRMTDEVVH